MGKERNRLAAIEETRRQCAPPSRTRAVHCTYIAHNWTVTSHSLCGLSSQASICPLVSIPFHSFPLIPFQITLFPQQRLFHHFSLHFIPFVPYVCPITFKKDAQRFCKRRSSEPVVRGRSASGKFGLCVLTHNPKYKMTLGGVTSEEESAYHPFYCFFWSF